MEKYAKNIKILQDNNIKVLGKAWNDKPDSVELKTFTDGGENMIINLEAPTKEELQKYIDGFDKDEHIMLWWGSGARAAHEKGVPFDNIGEHYEDLNAYLIELQRVCDLLS